MKFLEISPKEALIIDEALKELPDDEELRWFLIQLGRCIVGKEDVSIGLEEEDLWGLRNAVYSASSIDLVTKIYTLLLEIHNEAVLEGIELMPHAPLVTMEENNAEDQGSPDQDATEDCAESPAEETA